jgi:peptidyl-tRNA hydrolase, PTH1 family
MFLIFGLGNPGLEYKDTLHNIGFMVLDELAARSGLEFKKNKCGAKIAVLPFPGGGNRSKGVKSILRFKTFYKPKAIFAKPQTYMNLSGKSIECLKSKYGIKDSNIVVISDDLNLERGQVKIRPKGSSGGHKGLQSVIDEIRTEEFPRFRVGIGSPKENRAEDYVLSQIEPEDKAGYRNIIAKAADAVDFYLKEGVEKTMSKYNLKEII